MKRIASWCLVFAAAGACEPPSKPPGTGTSEAPLLITNLSNCTGAEAPAHITPVYTRPASDSVGIGALLEAGSYGVASDRDWVGVAGGNFCGGAEHEVVLLKNEHEQMSVMRGPTPVPVGGGDPALDTSQPWSAVAAGRLDSSGFDSMVMVRHVANTGAADLFIARADPSTCNVSTVASVAIGNPANSSWIGTAVGNFDGTGNQIAMLKQAHSSLFLVRYTAPSSLAVTFTSDLDSNTNLPWRAIAAGDLDGDGLDELVVARQASDGVSETLQVFKWQAGNFVEIAGSTIGNTGNSTWAGMTVGDFNGDGHASIVVTKNSHSNFFMFGLVAGSSTLSEIAVSDLDSAAGQDWRGLAATNWLDEGDQGAAELIAIRTAQDPYRADVFVYGDPFHRVARDSGMANMKAIFAQIDSDTPLQLVQIMSDAHANTLNWFIKNDPGQYDRLVDFLDATQNTCIDGQHLRVWASILPPVNGVGSNACSELDNDSVTPWNELADFANDPLSGGLASPCTGYLGWATTFGRLAQRYPHLVAVGIDDFSEDVARNFNIDLPGPQLSQMETNMRSLAPWLSFVPVAYSNNFSNNALPDLGRTVDSFQFYFRNNLQQECLKDPCGIQSVANLPGEVAFMVSQLPAGRKLQMGLYYAGLSTLYKGEAPSTNYDFQVMQAALNQPGVGGATEYAMDTLKDTTSPGANVCNAANATSSPLCAVAVNFGANACSPGETQACGNCGTQSCTANFTWGTCSNQGDCTPGDHRELSCGTPCSTETETCSASCQWVEGTCSSGVKPCDSATGALTLQR